MTIRKQEMASSTGSRPGSICRNGSLLICVGRPSVNRNAIGETRFVWICTLSAVLPEFVSVNETLLCRNICGRAFSIDSGDTSGYQTDSKPFGPGYPEPLRGLNIWLVLCSGANSPGLLLGALWS